jgi:hypothetical protein
MKRREIRGEREARTKIPDYASLHPGYWAFATCVQEMPIKIGFSRILFANLRE